MRSPKGHDVDERVILEKVLSKKLCGYTYFQTYFQIVTRINYKNSYGQ